MIAPAAYPCGVALHCPKPPASPRPRTQVGGEEQLALPHARAYAYPRRIDGLGLWGRGAVPGGTCQGSRVLSSPDAKEQGHVPQPWAHCRSHPGVAPKAMAHRLPKSAVATGPYDMPHLPHPQKGAELRALHHSCGLTQQHPHPRSGSGIDRFYVASGNGLGWLTLYASSSTASSIYRLRLSSYRQTPIPATPPAAAGPWAPRQPPSSHQLPPSVRTYDTCCRALAPVRPLPATSRWLRTRARRRRTQPAGHPPRDTTGHNSSSSAPERALASPAAEW